MTILIVLVCAAILAVIGVVSYVLMLFNNLVQVRHNVDQAWANIDVLLKERHDEIPKLVDVATGYMGYEKNLLESIVALRGRARDAAEGEQRVQAEQQLGAALGRLFVVAENYPDLKANQNFLGLQNRISALEEQIARRREFYNDSANTNNVVMEQMPETLLAGIAKMRIRALFEAAPEERMDVDVAGRLSNGMSRQG